MDIIEEILSKRTEYFKYHGKYPKTLLLPPDRERDVLSLDCVGNNMPSKPNPPIKKKVSIIKHGRLFTPGSMHEEIEYDHHAPDYLNALDRYEKEMDKYLRAGPELFIFGMSLVIDSRVDDIEVCA